MQERLRDEGAQIEDLEALIQCEQSLKGYILQSQSLHVESTDDSKAKTKNTNHPIPPVDPRLSREDSDGPDTITREDDFINHDLLDPENLIPRDDSEGGLGVVGGGLGGLERENASIGSQGGLGLVSDAVVSDARRSRRGLGRGLPSPLIYSRSAGRGPETEMESPPSPTYSPSSPTYNPSQLPDPSMDPDAFMVGIRPRDPTSSDKPKELVRNLDCESDDDVDENEISHSNIYSDSDSDMEDQENPSQFSYSSFHAPPGAPPPAPSAIRTRNALNYYAPDRSSWTSSSQSSRLYTSSSWDFSSGSQRGRESNKRSPLSTNFFDTLPRQ